MDFQLNYIYVGLHYQPEATTIPLGKHFANQWLMVDLLSKSIPEDTYLYVKFHPALFTRRNFENLALIVTDHFFDMLYKFNQLKNVKIVPLNIPSFDLIKSSIATATVTGTLSMESILMGKHSLVFGASPYLGFPGIWPVSNIESIKLALQKIEQKGKIDKESLRPYFNYIENTCAKYCTVSFEKEKIFFPELSHEQVISQMTEKISEYVKKII